MRVKTEAKRQAFIQAAGRLFIQHGVAAVSMEAIAAEARASKVTLYSYFPSRHDVFRAFVVDAGQTAADDLDQFRLAGQDVRTVLSRLGLTILQLMLKPDVMAINRLVIGEAARSPDLVATFFAHGPAHITAKIEAILQQCVDHGLLNAESPQQLALDFRGLCEVAVIPHVLWGVGERPTTATLQTIVDHAVETFLTGHPPPAR